jgi:hypothetical protein
MLARVDAKHPLEANPHRTLRAKHPRNPFRLPIMCTGLHPWDSAWINELQLSIGFISSWKTGPRWRLSCFSLTSPLQEAQIGVYSDRLDARCRRPASAASS